MADQPNSQEPQSQPPASIAIPIHSASNASLIPLPHSSAASASAADSLENSFDDSTDLLSPPSNAAIQMTNSNANNNAPSYSLFIPANSPTSQLNTIPPIQTNSPDSADSASTAIPGNSDSALAQSRGIYSRAASVPHPKPLNILSPSQTQTDSNQPTPAMSGPMNGHHGQSSSLGNFSEFTELQNKSPDKLFNPSSPLSSLKSFNYSRNLTNNSAPATGPFALAAPASKRINRKFGRTPTFVRATSRAEPVVDNSGTNSVSHGSVDSHTHNPVTSHDIGADHISKNVYRRAPFKSRLAHSQQTLARQEMYKDEDEEYSWRDVASYYLDGPIVTIVITCVVLIALILSIGGMIGMASNNSTDSLDLFCSIFFAIEVACRMLVYGFRRYFTSKLCILDLVATIFDWTSLILLDRGFGQFVFFRVLRAARLTKVAKISRLSNYSKESEEDSNFIQKDDAGRIFAYDPDRLFSLGFLMNVSGSVLTMPEIWIQFIFLVIVTSLWAANLCPIECDDLSQAYDHAAHCAGCAVSFSLESALMFAALVAFLLGMFDSMTFERWWAIRKLLSQLTEEKNHCAHLSMSYCPYEDKESTEYRVLLVRYLNLSMALLYKHADEDHNFTDLIRQGYLTEPEWDILEHERDKYSTVYSWLSRLTFEFQHQSNRFQSPHTALALFHSSFSLQRTLSNEIFMHVETQIPYSYAHLMTIIVKAHLLLVTAAAGTFVGRGIKEEQVMNALWGYLIVFFSNLVLEGLLRIHVVLYNPFGDDCCDIPASLLLNSVWESTHGIICRGHKPRYPFKTTDITFNEKHSNLINDLQPASKSLPAASNDLLSPVIAADKFSHDQNHHQHQHQSLLTHNSGETRFRSLAARDKLQAATQLPNAIGDAQHSDSESGADDANGNIPFPVLNQILKKRTPNEEQKLIKHIGGGE